MIKQKRPPRSISLLPTLSYLILCLMFIYVVTYFLFYKPLNNRYSSFHTTPVLDQNKMSVGYTLIAPYNRMANVDPSFEGKIYLTDMLGRIMHTWTTKHQPLYSILEKNGNLLVLMEAPKYTQLVPPGGNTGTIQELDWNSRVVWEYKNEMMHHDIVQLENGNITMALWEKTPPEIATRVSGGVPNTLLAGTMFSDEIVEINRAGNVVWSWHSSEHLDPNIDTIEESLPQYSWTHTNGIFHMTHNPIDGEEAYLISMRSLSEVLMVRKRDGQIIWRSPKGIFNLQHDPTLLPSGNIMVFDNGFARKPAPFVSLGSRAVEMDPRTNKIVWQFDGGEGVIDKLAVFAPIVSGAQRLPNGNTLITDGPRGHIFEVTPQKEVVWDMISPFETKMTGSFPNNFVFKTRKYAPNDINWPEKLPPAFSPLEFRMYQLLTKIYPKS